VQDSCPKLPPLDLPLISWRIRDYDVRLQKAMELRRHLYALNTIISATLMLVNAGPNELDGTITVSTLKKGLVSFYILITLTLQLKQTCSFGSSILP